MKRGNGRGDGEWATITILSLQPSLYFLLLLNAHNATAAASAAVDTAHTTATAPPATAAATLFAIGTIAEATSIESITLLPEKVAF